ncbi:hypothetical protein FQN53_008814 [Emmonsiellopsis sp. PD_33]|nr:hypothetical protein FQN53_008814 [Emmonsiellopsis sp. PD_33]
MAETVSITICGDGGCGKSSITLRLVRSQWTHEYDPTIEDSYSVTRTVDGLPYFLALTDTAGQEEYRGLWASSNLKSDAFLLVYDITSASSLETLDYFMEMIDIEAEQRLETNARLIREVGHSNRPGEEMALGMAPPVKIIAGNKCDLKDERVVTARQGLEYARRKGCGFMETSAREMVNIEETFALIVRRVVEARRLHHLQQFPPQGQRPPAHSALAAHAASQNLFPPDLIVSSQVDSHSRTPALTAKERELNDNNINEGIDGSHKQSQWQGIGKVISQRIRKMKSGDLMNQAQNHPSNDQNEKAAADRTSPNAYDQKRDGLPAIEETQRSQNDGSQTERNQQPWWRQAFCCSS